LPDEIPVPGLPGQFDVILPTRPDRFNRNRRPRLLK
jgi:hypothetical protein